MLHYRRLFEKLSEVIIFEQMPLKYVMMVMQIQVMDVNQIEVPLKQGGIVIHLIMTLQHAHLFEETDTF